MIFPSLRVNQYIIKEDQDELPQMREKNIVHETLEGSWCISEAKLHDHEFIVPIIRLESRFRNIPHINPYLMISSPKVQFQKEFCPMEFIK